MRELTCIIVDDHSFAITLLKAYLTQFSELKLLDTFTDPVLARTYINEHKGIDILFTDVEMPKISGIELVESISTKVNHVVFVTSRFRHELRPKMVGKWHYLFKPSRLEEFREVFLEIQSEYK
ncbi:response regulator [Pedobacter sp. G11]|uniref:LytR/AlgR family response regulator transcription factor n=1 Tax=Pedobacter sp. G11 TaxID=2482728 RepID=UPI000F5FC5EE|nr:response regulator [Pedobacter sp. G11]AZI24154.1 response regulator [Pedobacter sp. G11]